MEQYALGTFISIQGVTSYWWSRYVVCVKRALGEGRVMTVVSYWISALYMSELEKLRYK